MALLIQKKAEEAVAELKAQEMEVGRRVTLALQNDLTSGRVVSAFASAYLLRYYNTLTKSYANRTCPASRRRLLKQKQI